MSGKVLAVVGGGVVGLAVARHAARRGLQVVVLERNAAIGLECSSRNSEVIHAGIYYPKNSFKATLCVRGKHMLYDFCRDFHVPHQRCGKLVVATSSNQVDTLRQIQAKAQANGVHDIEIMSKAQVARLEPDVHSEGGLLSPSTGIVDSHAFMLALQGDAEAHGASFAFHCSVDSGDWNASSNEFLLRYQMADDGATLHELPCDFVVNCAGLGAPFVANSFPYPIQFAVPTPSMFAKGNYFRLSNTVKPFRHLIYPVPESGGLGVHATLDMAGHVRFGPDVDWTGEMQYTVNASKEQEFASRIAAYWPAMAHHDLVPDYCGIRPKLGGPHDADLDFMLADASHHGMPGLVHCCGIESPGLTSSLAIADEVLARLGLTNTL
ncbi:hypothetical protein AaE_000989 [Aphanomyces astaci]|uniref:L-2-hydroxyglutarate dehydrogenase, mitochondrial n=1 Tax=Aphanomyces astaci TaxID=112090 RepID=A0A6A5AJE7_APHAT|nr:hypothetical protein AaE_000989 [Aphanomyces astaci]